MALEDYSDLGTVESAPTITANVDALIQHESGGDPSATGDAGLAVGLGQMHPEVRKAYGVTPDSTPEEQRKAVESYFTDLYKKHNGNVDDALSEYHLGATNYNRDRNSPDNVAYLNKHRQVLQATAGTLPHPAEAPTEDYSDIGTVVGKGGVPQAAEQPPSTEQPTPAPPEEKPLPGVVGGLEPYRALHEAGIPLERNATVEDTGAQLNKQFGLSQDHKLGRYLAAGGKPFLDAASDLINLISGDKPPPKDAMADAIGNLSRLTAAMHPVTAAPEAFGNTLVELASDAGLHPTVGAILGTLGQMYAGSKIPTSEAFAGAGGKGWRPTTAPLSPEVTTAVDLGPAMPLKGTAASRQAAQEAASAATEAEARAAAARTAQTAETTAAEQQATRAQQTAEQAKAAVQPSVAARTEAEAALTPGIKVSEPPTAEGTVRFYRGEGPRTPQFRPNETSGMWTTDRSIAEQYVKSGGQLQYVDANPNEIRYLTPEIPLKTQQLPNSVINRAKVLSTIESVSPRQGGQAAAAGLEQRLQEWKEPTQGIYNAYIGGTPTTPGHATEIVDPTKYKSLSDEISTLEDAGRLTGQAGKTISALGEKINTGQRVTIGDLDNYKQALDEVLPGGPPKGANQSERALYDFKLGIRDIIRSTATGEEKAWLDAADSIWRDVIIGKGKPRALGPLVNLVKKDPETAVERIFGNGTRAAQGEMAEAVMKQLGDHPAAEVMRQAFMKRLINNATDTISGEMDPKALTKAAGDLDPTFKSNVLNDGAETFFKTLQQQQKAAEAADVAAKAAKARIGAGGARVAEAEETAKQAQRTATRAQRIAEKPNMLANMTAKGLEVAVGEAAASAFGHPGLGPIFMARFLFPADQLATYLANSKTANLLARALKTPANSVVVPVLMQKIKSATEEKPKKAA